MVLYTPLAWEDIFPDNSASDQISECWIEGRLCLLRHGADGSVRLERLLSTNPQDYLDPRFQPHSAMF